MNFAPAPDMFPARDLFDVTAVAAFEPSALRSLGGALRANRAVLLERLRAHGEALREDFAALHAREFNPGFEECVAALRTALSRSLPPPVVEQGRCPYQIGHRGFIRASTAGAIHPGF